MIACATVPAMLLAACDREQRGFRESPPSATPTSIVRVSTLQPGGAIIAPSDSTNSYDDNAYAVSEGQRLFAWYNCSGCHARGGGGMGPPLIDDMWIYGSAPSNIYHTIVEGRPNGMPSFGGRIPPSQVWQLVAYVRTLGALNSQNARSARDDHMMSQPGSQIQQKGGTPKPAEARPTSRKP